MSFHDSNFASDCKTWNLRSPTMTKKTSLGSARATPRAIESKLPSYLAIAAGRPHVEPPSFDRAKKIDDPASVVVVHTSPTQSPMIAMSSAPRCGRFTDLDFGAPGRASILRSADAIGGRRSGRSPVRKAQSVASSLRLRDHGADPGHTRVAPAGSAVACADAGVKVRIPIAARMPQNNGSAS